MAINQKEPDDSLDFTVILTNPSLAATQSWMVAEAMVSRPGGAAPPPLPPPAAAITTPALNDQFLIGAANDSGAGAAVQRIRRRSGAAVPLRDAPVLVVDDDLITRKLLERLLVKDGYQVRVAGTRDEFMMAMKGQPRPALIMLDVNMPDMDGFSVLSRLRQHAAVKEVAVILVTARCAPEDVERAFALGADGYLSKPVKVGIVRKALTAILGAR